MPTELVGLQPVPTLITRLRQELAADFDLSRPIRISRAPGRLDVMGGIADYTGSLVCEATLGQAAALALQERNDRQIKVLSLNLRDENQSFTVQMPLEDILRCDFAGTGRRWAGYLLGCLYVLHQKGLINLRDAKMRGLNMALYSSVPLGAGVSSSAAIEVAAMINLRDQLKLQERMDAVSLAAMCQEVENRVVGAPCGIMDQITSCAGEADSLLRLICQPHNLLSPLHLPDGVRVVGINSAVKHSVGGGEYGRTRCAAFMAHRIIAEKMGRDPMGGYLANLAVEDYQKDFRSSLPEDMLGEEFTAKYGKTIDTATQVEPAVRYQVRRAADHHVLESQRVKSFVAALEQAGSYPRGAAKRALALDRAGSLMYESHWSYGNNAMLGARECDLIVELVRKRQNQGFYGAKITGGGCGGTVAVLAGMGESVDQALQEVMDEYRKVTGQVPQLLEGSSPGAWEVGTKMLTLAE